jgi:hypothetical protein
MRHAGRLSLILFALAGLLMAHTAAYLLTFRCWSCHEALMDATHTAIAGSSAGVLAVVALLATLVAGRSTVRTRSASISTSRLVAAEAAAFVILELLERHGSLSQTFIDSTTILELGLVFLTASLLARFARVVEHVICSIRASGSSSRRASDPRPPRPAALSGGPRATAYNATGFLRAPPLPA